MPEYTPPVIYSQGARAKLVYLVEAKPDDIDSALRPGLPDRSGALAMTMASAIDVKGLVKIYGSRVVVDHVDLAIAPGRICGFLGPNGSGKTTTLRMICGLLTPDGGSGTCLGHDIITERDAVKRQAGYMTQRFGLYEDLTIRENLEFVGRLYRLEQLAPPRRRVARAAGPGHPPAPADRLAVGRLEAAPGTGRLRAARTQAAAARRTDGGRRPQGAARLLG